MYNEFIDYIRVNHLMNKFKILGAILFVSILVIVSHVVDLNTSKGAEVKEITPPASMVDPVYDTTPTPRTTLTIGNIKTLDAIDLHVIIKFDQLNMSELTE